MKLSMYLFYLNLKKKKEEKHVEHSYASPVQLRLCQENRWRRILERLRMSASLDGVCLLHPRPPSSPPISNAKQKRSDSSTDGSLSSQFKRAVFPFSEEMDRLVQKAEISKTLHPFPLRAPSRVVSCVPMFRRRRAGPIIGESSFFFSFCAPPTCHPVQSRLPLSFAATESFAGGSLLRVLLTLRLKQETVPPFSHRLPAFRWSLAAPRVTCSLKISLTKMNADCGDAALESIIKKKKVWRLNKEHSFSITATTVAMVTTKHERHFETISGLDELIVLELSITTLMCSKVASERHGTGANFPTPKYQKHHSAVWKWH